MGIGTALYRKLERDAVAHGARVLDGFTSDEPSVGQVWFEHLGFCRRSNRLRAFYAELTDDVPGGEGMAEPTPGDCKQQTVLSEGWEPKEVHLPVDGDRWVGMSRVHRLPDGSFVNDLTDVDRDCRGRGVATAVKVKALEYARNKGGTWIRTHNDATNRPMLAVNRKLGYIPEPGMYRFSRTVS
jgi:GNAT superfamily N-acetyltransferase